eukprot:271357-Amphidinium_carterae.1
MTTPFAPIFAVFGWESDHPWLTNVQYIDWTFKDLKKRQLFTHPDKVAGTSVADCWPEDDLEDSAKYMTSEMSYLRDLRTKILAEAEEAAKKGKGPSNATPAGGTGASASSSSATGGTKKSQPKGPPPGYQPRPPPPQPGRDESANP